MTCTRIRDEVLELARRPPDAASEAVSATARVQAHLATCASCRALFEEQRALTAALRAVAHETSEWSEQVDFEAMERRLVTEFDRDKARVAATVEGARDDARSARWRQRRPSPVQVTWLRVAALLALAAGAAATWHVLRPADGTASRSPDAVSARSPEPPAAILPMGTGGAGPADTASGASGAHGSTSAPATPGAAVDAVPGLPSRQGGSVREGMSGGGGSLAASVAGEGRGAHLSSVGRGEPGFTGAAPVASAGNVAAARSGGTAGPSPTATPGALTGARPGSGPPARPPADPLAPRVVEAAGFVPLPLSDSLPPFERGEIVRLEVDVPSLPAYGVRMPPDPGDRPILVDLLIGQDGIPRAVRLVTHTLQDSRNW